MKEVLSFYVLLFFLIVVIKSEPIETCTLLIYTHPQPLFCSLKSTKLWKMTFQKLICANSFEIKYGPNDVRPLIVFISFIQCTSLTLFCRYIKMLFGRCYVPYCFSVVGGLVAESSLTLVTPWTVACQAPPSMEFSRQEYWSGCHFLLQGIFLTQGSNLGLMCCRWILYPWAIRETLYFFSKICKYLDSKHIWPRNFT